MKRLGAIGRWLLWSALSCVHAAEPMEIGVGTHRWHLGLAPEEVDRMLTEARVTSWRDGINWAAVERRRGVYTIPLQFEALMHAADAAPARGLRPMVIVGYGNPLYQAGGLVTTHEAREGFAAYARWLATRLKGKVRYYEIWNEWNIGTGSTATPRAIGSVDDYARLLRVAADAIRAVDPQARIIAGGATNNDTAWFDAFGRSGALDIVDGVSIHPYNYGRPLFAHTPEAAMAWVQDIQTRLSKRRGRAVTMYVTEIGWPSLTGGYTPDQVADYLERFMRLARRDPHVAGVWWYDLVNDGDSPDDPEHHFGLFDRQHRPLPALRALRACCGRRGTP
ncbi:cellulase family glycosylhydrolase [Dyella sp. 2RAB6]|uniref:cellulase family glycosylhydrolase n=1 Tax=Dyella sp. 2RAB6 TaxID=3232992 RepID=UPI003F92D3CC